MSSITEVLAALDDAVDALRTADFTVLTLRQRYDALERLETTRRRQVAIGSTLVHGLEDADGWPPVHRAMADVLRISPGEAKRRIRVAAQLMPRTTLTGQAMPPELAATAEAYHDGLLDPEHLRTIQGFMTDLPDHVAPAEAEKAERFLAEQATVLRPDQLTKLADQLSVRLNPDGEFSDADRARKRGFTWSGKQGPDGMSAGKLIATPELRAMLEAWLAKFAAPGMCNPDDQAPTVTGQPSQDVIDRDVRGHAQRQHDALAALVRGQLGDPKLGQHNGLPVTVIASATVQDLQAQTGHAVTAGGTLLPIRDLIRMARHAYHYLSLFDGSSGRPLWLGRTKRIASADQRIVLHATDCAEGA